MFNRTIVGEGVPRRLSLDHDPLFTFHRWQANLRVLGVERSRPFSLPVSPRLSSGRSEPFGVSIWIACCSGMRRRSIGSWRPSPWHYNEYRVHDALDGRGPSHTTATATELRATQLRPMDAPLWVGCSILRLRVIANSPATG
jgi:hypothetical protein